jgi:Domain of unknown function (DUF4168)
MTLTSKLLAVGALAALVVFPASAAFAQSSGAMGDSGSAASSSSGAMGESGSMASSPSQSAQVDDATLQKAAKAYVKVKQIVQQSKQAQAAGSGAQANPTAAQSEKIAAVRNEGLEPQQYNQIIQMVENDPQLQQKFASYVNQNGGDTD